MKLGRIERFILGYCATAPRQPVLRQELLAAYYGGPVSQLDRKRYRQAHVLFSRAIKTLASKGYLLLIDQCDCRFHLQEYRPVAILGREVGEPREVLHELLQAQLQRYLAKRATVRLTPFPFVKAVQLTPEGLKKAAGLDLSGSSEA